MWTPSSIIRINTVDKSHLSLCGFKFLGHKKPTKQQCSFSWCLSHKKQHRVGRKRYFKWKKSEKSCPFILLLTLYCAFWGSACTKAEAGNTHCNFRNHSVLTINHYYQLWMDTIGSFHCFSNYKLFTFSLCAFGYISFPYKSIYV